MADFRKPKRKKIGGRLDERVRIGENTWVTIKRKRGKEITVDVVEEVPQVESETIANQEGEGI